jgi:CTP synthase (UTP-ammonia lyase)
MQYAVIEYFRNVLGAPGASHAEDGFADNFVVTALACSLQGEQREVRSVPGTRFAEIAGPEPFMGMHFCGYATDPDRVGSLVEGGLVIGAVADDAGVEVFELPSNRFCFLSMFQPHIGASTGQSLHRLVRLFACSSTRQGNGSANSPAETQGGCRMGRQRRTGHVQGSRRPS